MSRAQVSDDVIADVYPDTGTIYQFGPNDIVYREGPGCFRIG